MYIRRNTAVKYCVVALFGAVLYAEKFVYLIQPLFWQDLECHSHDNSCTKILFIADPQIQGDTAVPPPLSYLFNWDSDRYLKQTFSVALGHFKPNVLVYLGDLMDEGSIATMETFHKYVKRLVNIFDVDYPIVQVWIPGDNDIGGENEAIKYDKVKEFRKVFDQPDVVKYRNISFYKVNAITHTFPKDTEENNSLKIVVSHYPLLMRQMFLRQINSAINPNIFFCAHDHESKYVTQNKKFEGGTGRPTPFYERKVLDISFDDYKFYEVYVPTCSYRMGTSRIGFGAGVLDNNNQKMRYTVFWSPMRFPYLFFYLVILIFLFIFCLSCCVIKLCCSYYNSIQSGKLPLYTKL